jgi:hypothetical protein
MSEQRLKRELARIVSAARHQPGRVTDDAYDAFVDQCEAAAVAAGANWRAADRAHRIRALPDRLEQRLNALDARIRARAQSQAAPKPAKPVPPVPAEAPPLIEPALEQTINRLEHLRAHVRHLAAGAGRFGNPRPRGRPFGWRPGATGQAGQSYRRDPR